MAKHLKVVLLDDLDGSTADHTVAFSLDGLSYEIDLNTENVDRLHDILAPFAAKARKTRPAASADGSPGQTRVSRKSPALTPPVPDNSATEPVGETTPQEDKHPRPADVSDTTTARSDVPAALFSSPTAHVAPLPASAPKPQVAGLFSTGS